MADWLSLSGLALDLFPLAREIPADLPLREAAAAVALRRWGETVYQVPSTINAAALAVSAARGRLMVHQVRPGAAHLVAETDLHSLPAEAPRLLRRPWILEARRPEKGEVLFGRTAALGGYTLDGVVYLVGLDYPDGARVARWTPRWTGGELEAGIPPEASPLIDDVAAHRDWAREAARFVVVLGLLLDAEGAPLRISDEIGGAGSGKGRGRRANAPAWAIRHVYLERPERRGGGGSGAGEGAPVDGRLSEVVPVRGHLKRQRHGPGNQLVKWIYVAGYEARRWVAPRATVVVDR